MRRRLPAMLAVVGFVAWTAVLTVYFDRLRHDQVDTTREVYEDRLARLEIAYEDLRTDQIRQGEPEPPSAEEVVDAPIVQEGERGERGEQGLPGQGVTQAMVEFALVEYVAEHPEFGQPTQAQVDEGVRRLCAIMDCVGPIGPQGAAGVDGSDGQPGADGADGAPGPQGLPGADATQEQVNAAVALLCANDACTGSSPPQIGPFSYPCGGLLPATCTTTCRLQPDGTYPCETVTT